MSVNETLLSVRGLSTHYFGDAGVVRAVGDVSFSIGRGRTFALVGESGCGKTTVARLILKLLAKDDGKVIFRSLDISDFTEKEMKPIRKEMQIVFQDPFG